MQNLLFSINNMTSLMASFRSDQKIHYLSISADYNIFFICNRNEVENCSSGFQRNEAAILLLMKHTVKEKYLLFPYTTLI
jgi:hypothetical protein